MGYGQELERVHFHDCWSTPRFYTGWIKWKGSSLEPPSIGIAGLPKGGHIYRRVESVAVLGGVVTDDSRTPNEPMQTQLGKSEAFFRQAASWFTRGSSVRSRVHAWARGIRGCAQYASQTWALSGENLHQLKSWELRFLRTALKVRPTPAETDHGATTYMGRTAHIMRHFLFKFITPSIYESVLRLYYRAAHREISFRLPGGEAVLGKLRRHRSLLRWGTLKSLAGGAPPKRYRAPRGGGKDSWLLYTGLPGETRFLFRSVNGK